MSKKNANGALNFSGSPSTIDQKLEARSTSKIAGTSLACQGAISSVMALPVPKAGVRLSQLTGVLHPHLYLCDVRSLLVAPSSSRPTKSKRQISLNDKRLDMNKDTHVGSAHHPQPLPGESASAYRAFGWFCDQ